MPPQIKRLLLVFGIFILVFIIVRQLLVPPSFGEFGHYRGKSLIENMDKPLAYAGSDSCMRCHAENAAMKDTSVHASLKCEVCHGPCLQHVLHPKDVKPQKPITREFCGLCHSKNAARNKDVIPQIDLKEHNTDQKCVECHNPHNPWKDLK